MPITREVTNKLELVPTVSYGAFTKVVLRGLTWKDMYPRYIAKREKQIVELYDRTCEV